MTRIHLFEFTDLTWYPQTFRTIQTDYLQLASSLGSGHKNLIPLLINALQKAKTSNIIDLCSGGMGPWKNLQKQLEKEGVLINIKLTDKYPNLDSIRRISDLSNSRIRYISDSIDATNVPEQLEGMRTIFEGFHHFKPEQARQILMDAQEKGRSIGVFDASLIPPFGIILLVLSPIITLLTYLFATPFIRPFSLSRLFWTYILPIVPLATCWDGIVSLIRVYSVEELNNLVNPIKNTKYIWETGLVSTGTPIFNFTYIVGYPNA